MADQPDAATPLDPDEAAGLIPAHVRTQAELNEWEQTNILEGQKWALARGNRADLLTEAFVRELHRRMFDRTWRWAGRFRSSDKNIGIDWRQIGVRLKDLLDDTRYWLEHGTYTIDEIAARFHHRLVSIHPFANGNGRHVRLMADCLLARRGVAPFSWGRGDLLHVGAARDRYLAALRSADGGDIAPLLAFVRS
jgi:Fic-DOC domain mobile mystery protein B